MSNHQKRELAGVTALVMASTVFFLTPLMVPPGSPPGLTPLVAAGGAATPDAVIPEPQPVVLSASVVTPAAGAPRADARLRRAPLKAVRAGFAATRVSSVQAASARETARSKRKGVSGAMVRVLVGTGRHRVQPFPTPASGD